MYVCMYEKERDQVKFVDEMKGSLMTHVISCRKSPKKGTEKSAMIFD